LRWLPHFEISSEVNTETSQVLECEVLEFPETAAKGESFAKQRRMNGKKLTTKHYLSQAPDEPETASGSETIVIVDDDRDSSNVLISKLTGEGYNVLAVFEEEELLNILDRNSGIGLVMLNLTETGMSGHEICGKIRKRHSMAELPVLILTARTGPEEMKLSFSAGANDFWVKPYDLEELIVRVRTLIKLRLSVQAVVKTEMDLLQARIKPHFIFNVLNTVSFFCETEPALAAKLMDEFSNYLRWSLDFSCPNSFITLEQEISLIKSYLALENARFGEKLKVFFHLDESAFTQKIPALILQPIVENAVKHGILPRENGGNLTIRVKLEKNQLIMCVEDDGFGINPGVASSLHLMEGPQGKGSGLKNIQKRIFNIYGRSINISSEKGMGTCVTIIIPAQEGEDYDTGSRRG